MSWFYYTILFYCFKKNVKLLLTHSFVMKIPNKRELQPIAFNHLSDIDFQGFMNLYKVYCKTIFFFLVIDTTLASDNSIRFRKNLLERK